MNILVVDDNELVRKGVLSIVSEEFSAAKVQEASNGIEAERFGRSQSWNMIVMDMSMPDKTGLDVIKQFRSEADKVPLLILSIHPEN